MLWNYALAAWRIAVRDRLHAIINVLGLTVGLAAVILIGLYLRHELSFDDFLIDGAQIHRVSTRFDAPGRAPSWFARAPRHAAAALALEFPEFTGIARLSPERIGVRHGADEAAETVSWADPAFLSVLGLRMIAGDAATALAAPDGVVLTRSAARKYFGADLPLGETLDFNRTRTMRVTGVIDDLPSNTHLTLGIIASGRAAQSPLAVEDAEPQQPGSNSFNGFLYVRVKPGVVAASLDARLAGFVKSHFAAPDGSTFFGLTLDPVTRLHLLGYNGELKESADPTTLAAIGLIGVLILMVAGINFVNLMTARAGRRAVEIGIRKASGATRAQLIGQFLGEAVGFAVIAMVLAIGLVELALPAFNATMDCAIRFAYWRDPALGLALGVTTLLVGLGAGLYPALVLSSVAPVAALKSGRVGGAGGRLRQALVILQFSTSIALVVATIVILGQTGFATSRALRFETDQIMAVEAPEACGEAFRQRVAGLPGVRDAVCSEVAPLAFSKSGGTGTLADGREVGIDLVDVDFGFMEFYGLPTLAGRSFERNRGQDAVATARDAPMESAIVINEASVRAFGFASPAAALDQIVTVSGVRPSARPSRIIGVVPDFPIGSIREKVEPSVFFVDPGRWGLLSVKLTGGQIPETLAAIDHLWSETGAVLPIHREFLDREIENLYRDIQRQGRVLAGFSAFAIMIGSLGLFGLSAFAAERRTKEIGIRKALGASTGDVVQLLIWQFAKPVLIANVIAWPVAWFVMRRWLDGFAYRISLSWEPFVLAGVSALVIAILTTGFHAVQVARSRPVAALRYE